MYLHNTLPQLHTSSLRPGSGHFHGSWLWA